MATKNLATWQKEAQALAKKIGKEPIKFAEGVTIEDMQSLVEALGAELKSAEEALQNAAAKKKPAIAFEYYVADGKSITSKRGRKGMLHAGDEIKADHLGGAIKALEALVAKGAVIANPNYKK